jgi:hypothetical protein
LDIAGPLQSLTNFVDPSPKFFQLADPYGKPSSNIQSSNNYKQETHTKCKNVKSTTFLAVMTTKISFTRSFMLYCPEAIQLEDPLCTTGGPAVENGR